MKVLIGCFSKRGCGLAESLYPKLQKAGYAPDVCVLSAHIPESRFPHMDSLSDFCRLGFASYRAIVFIGACGIAVRGIAPYVSDKTKDPAVIVMDELSHYCIPVLSGHVGGANRLTRVLSKLSGAEPVITTATDINHIFAVDSWAKEHDLVILNPGRIKTISSALLAGKQVGFHADSPYQGVLPLGLYAADQGDLGIQVSIRKTPFFGRALYLIPHNVTVGIGCRKGIPAKTIRDAVWDVLRKNEIYLESVLQVCSIDLKQEEQGIIEFCREESLEFITYTMQELSKLSGQFTSSDFVASVTGVDNVCERAAVKGSGGRLIVRKQTINGVTVALAAPDPALSFLTW